jgi:hypothetical protein
MWDTKTHDFYGDRCGLDLFKEFRDEWVVFGDLDTVAIEFPQSYGINAGMSLFATAFQAGRIAEVFSREGYNVFLYGRPSIKGQIGGRNDSEIRRSLMMRHGGSKKGEKLHGVKADIWAALALAVALDENPKLRRVELSG